MHIADIIPSIIAAVNHSENVSASMHTIPSLFIISAPKTGSSSLIKWLVDTNEIFGDSFLGLNQVENNALWIEYISKMVHRNDSGFYVSDTDILNFNDAEYLKSFMHKPRAIPIMKKGEKSARIKKFKRRNSLFLPNDPNVEENRMELMQRQEWFTVAKSVFYFHLPYMARVFASKYRDTKVLIMVRNPIRRLLSNYLFFVGDERKQLAELYGDVNLYLSHILNHPLLKGPFEEIKGNLSVINMGNGVADMKRWSNVFAAYNTFLVNVVKVCKEDFSKMKGVERSKFVRTKENRMRMRGRGRQNKIDEICTERDVIRNAFGTSCFIVPIMKWFFTNVNPKRNLRILQSEIMFERSDEYVSRILCWVQMDYDGADCNGWGDKKWDTGQQWRGSEKDGNEDEISVDITELLQAQLRECNIALKQFVDEYNFVSLTPFELSLWE